MFSHIALFDYYNSEEKISYFWDMFCTLIKLIELLYLILKGLL